MAESRYTFTEKRKRQDGKRVRNVLLYPTIEPKSTDYIIEAQVGDRLDKLADLYYNDASLWWIIASVNNLGKGSIYVPAGTMLRIPADLSDYYQQMRKVNNR